MNLVMRKPVVFVFQQARLKLCLLGFRCEQEMKKNGGGCYTECAFALMIMFCHIDLSCFEKKKEIQQQYKPAEEIRCVFDDNSKIVFVNSS